jgi:hypothetical protein
MSITIVRHTGWMGMGSAIEVKINAQKVVKVGNEQQVIVELPSNRAQLAVSLSGTKSNTLTVEDGETIKITTLKRRYLIFFLTILIPFFTNLVPSFQYRMLALLTYVIVFLIMLFRMKWYQLTKI